MNQESSPTLSESSPTPSPEPIIDNTIDYEIFVLNGNTTIMNLRAKASSLEELREKYIGMITKLRANNDITVTVYSVDANGDRTRVTEPVF